MTENNTACPNRWAILEFVESGYMLRENQLVKETAESLAKGEYKDRDIILTISSEDLPRRISGLNRLVFA
ncbi:MAG: hypothetical protein II969_17825 [Anaerolineaceae bacterium]|nr:hypothetical protein [Anaerolineaceae bacterium]